MPSELFWFEAAKPIINPRERRMGDEEKQAILAESDKAVGETEA